MYPGPNELVKMPIGSLTTLGEIGIDRKRISTDNGTVNDRSKVLDKQSRRVKAVQRQHWIKIPAGDGGVGLLSRDIEARHFGDAQSRNEDLGRTVTFAWGSYLMRAGKEGTRAPAYCGGHGERRRISDYVRVGLLFVSGPLSAAGRGRRRKGRRARFKPMDEWALEPPHMRGIGPYNMSGSEKRREEGGYRARGVQGNKVRGRRNLTKDPDMRCNFGPQAHGVHRYGWRWSPVARGFAGVTEQETKLVNTEYRRKQLCPASYLQGQLALGGWRCWSRRQRKERLERLANAASCWSRCFLQEQRPLRFGSDRLRYHGPSSGAVIYTLLRSMIDTDPKISGIDILGPEMW
ncbi:hypothetical protein B0H11DRAFT_1924938 [Mycena galericulata]|nr:hypothetical protein B0H11DRAFT_1924938 [Mycena galericulata]